MPTRTALAPADDIQRAPAFTLGTALMWLGHDCRGDCPTAATDCPAGVWFLHLPGTAATWTTTLVDVDFRDPPWREAGRGDVLGLVNRCVRPDKLRVRERTPVQRAVFLSALAARRADPGQRGPSR